MKHIIEKANHYYSLNNEGCTIFYKLQQEYVAFGDNIAKIGYLMGIRPRFYSGVPCIALSHADYIEKSEILSLCSVNYKAVIYCDDDGELCIPDIERIIYEQEIDY